MTGWERLGIGVLSQGYLSGRLSPAASRPGRHLSQATTSPAVIAVGAIQLE